MRFVLLGVGMFAISLPVLHGQAGVPSSLPLPVLVTVAATAGLATGWVRRSWWPLSVVGAVTYAWLMMWPPLLLASYYAGRSLSGRRDIAGYLGGCLVVCGISALVGAWQELPSGALGNALFMALAVIGLPFALGLWVRARHEVQRRAEREQVMRAEQARAQERARIAREMHDVVAHRVSLIVLHAGALEVRAADEETARTAAMIGGIGREALTHLRDVLGVLRSSKTDDQPPPTLADLDRLLDQSRALGIAVTRRDEGHVRPVEPTVERTAYRVVQEALTNVHKHAGAARTDVRIRYGPEELEVEVRNQAPGSPRPELPDSGWGLVGLRERVELLGGTLRTNAQEEGGFLVSARIPA
ncbi:histidine kinase [Nonomuraea turkmeniaca]|uniref:histidine kinase n=1 Tax=Nonomuraea turkmeniaca TaxID=103838 RepID=A0A5S4F6M0_9ACTN|nr:histidine kinase [Nonomuraea turkmeniaca]TMR11863.1 histidine kinase [Nonomuraea turkmeniaca]